MDHHQDIRITDAEKDQKLIDGAAISESDDR